MVFRTTRLLSNLVLCLAAQSATAFVPASRSMSSARISTTSNSNKAPLFPNVTPENQRNTATQLYGTQEELTTYLLETVISSGVPTVFTLIVIGFAASSLRSLQQNKRQEEQASEGVVAELYSDLYGSDAKQTMLPPFFSPPGGKSTKAKNTGVPAQQFFKVNKRNDQLQSYDFTLTAATQSKAAAARQGRRDNFAKALRMASSSNDMTQDLSNSQMADLLAAEKELLQKGAKVQQTIVELSTALTQSAIDEEMKAIGASQMDADPILVDHEDKKKNATTTAKFQLPFNKNKKDPQVWKALGAAQQNLNKLELNFIQDVIQVLGPERANGVRTALLGDVATRGAGGLLSQMQDRPLTTLLQDSTEEKNLFVAQFPGDPTASQVADLREEVTAIVRSAQPGDEALVVLQTGGGTVTGYGLAAAQLQRFKDKGMKLTICVEQVAASGGYMMACIADKIIASPFAVLGSIGVISDIPNFYDRLKEEGIEFQTITAGKYKRTITPTKKITKEDVKKSKEDIEDVLKLFKAFVADNRPSLDIEKVATGETWFGEDALKLGLCDEIKTVDDVIMDYVDAGFNVYDVKYDPPPIRDGSPLAQLLPSSSQVDSEGGSIIAKGIRWLVRTVSSEITSELKASQSAERKYMAKDDTSERFRVE